MAEYIYFCSSLPALRLQQYGTEVPIKSEDFLNSASVLLSGADYQKICDLDFSRSSERVAEGAFLSEYYGWEVALRNQVIQQRLKLIEQRSVSARPRSGASSSLALAVEQISQQDPLAIERSLDQLRWARLDELCGARLFDMVFLACYLLKLRLLERAALWQKEVGYQLYEDASQAIVQSDATDEKKLGEAQ